MANKQIYELTTRTFDGDSLLPISVENPDSSTATEYPQLTGKTSGNALSDFVANSQQYATDLDTENKTITGAINELHSSIGANTFNTSSTYNKGDIVIYNGTLYACKDNSVTGAWDATKWDDTTLQPKTDNTLATTDKTVVGAINELNTNKFNSSDIYSEVQNVAFDSDGFGSITTPASYYCFSALLDVSWFITVMDNSTIIAHNRFDYSQIIKSTTANIRLFFIKI